MKITNAILLLLLPFLLQAQGNDIYIDVPLYFEDSIGNKDTVVISLSESGSLDFLPGLGEINLVGVPFDSTFDVRIVPFEEISLAYEVPYQVKRKFFPITPPLPNGDCTSLGLGDNVAFVVHTRHYPITISWNSEPFQSGGLLECLSGSRISNTFLSLIIRSEVALQVLGIDPAYPIGCLKDDSEQIEYYPYSSYPLEGETTGPRGLYNPFNDWTLLPVAGSDLALDTMLIYSLWWATEASPLCGKPVSAPDVVSDSGLLTLSPNPTTNLINLNIPDPGTSLKNWSVFDAHGRQVLAGKTDTNQLNVSSLPGGSYFVRVQFDDGRVAAAKFVRQ